MNATKSQKTVIILNLILLAIPSLGMAQVPQEQHSTFEQVRGTLRLTHAYVRKHVKKIGAVATTACAVAAFLIFRNSLLKTAVRRGNRLAAGALLAVGADVNGGRECYRMKRPLVEALRRQDIPMANLLLDADASHYGFSSCDTHNIIACWGGYVHGNVGDVIESLKLEIVQDNLGLVQLMYRLKVNFNFDGCCYQPLEHFTPVNPLSLAVYCGCTDVVDFLLNTPVKCADAHGQQLNLLDIPHNKTITDAFGETHTVFEWACKGKKRREGQQLFFKKASSLLRYNKAILQRPVANWDTIIASLKEKGCASVTNH